MGKRWIATAITALLLLGSTAAPGRAAAQSEGVTVLRCEPDDAAKVSAFGDESVTSELVDTAEKKEGSASFAMGAKSGGIPYLDLQMNGLSINVAADFDLYNLEFWLYIKDIKSLPTNAGLSRIELGSSDELDDNRVFFDLGTLAYFRNLKNGWNQVKVPLALGNIQNVNFQQLSRFRLVVYCAEGADSIEIRLDDVALRPATAEKTSLISDGESANPYLFDIHTDGNIKYPIFDTDCKEGNYSIAAVTKGGGANIPAMMMSKSGLPFKLYDLGDVSNKAMEGWFYVSDIADLAESRVELGSSGSDTRNVYYFWLFGEGGNKLTTGWNHIKIPFSDCQIKGRPDATQINWVRIYGVGTGEGEPLTFKFDDVRIVDANEAGTQPPVTSSGGASSSGGPDSSDGASSSGTSTEGAASSGITSGGADGSDAAVNNENSQNSNQNGGGAGWILPVIIVVVLAAAAVVGGILLYRKFFRPADGTQETEPENDGSDTGDDKS